MKRQIIPLLVIIGVLCIIPHASAQEIISREMPLSHELISNEVWDVYQDKTGYIWIATQNGLARYDGHRLQTFKNDYHSPHRLTDNRITDLAENNSYLWIGTRKGVNLMDKSTYSISLSPDENLCRENIEWMVPSADDGMWIAAEASVYRCAPDGSVQKKYDMTEVAKSAVPVKVNTMYQDKEGTLWCMLGRGGLCRYDARQDAFLLVDNTPDLDFFTMFQDRKGRYWLGTWGNGFWEYLPKEEVGKQFRFQPLAGTKDAGDNANVYSIEQDDALGYLWLLSHSGLYVLDVSAPSAVPVNLSDRVDVHKMYTRIVKDREGNLWISSYDIGRLISFDHSGIQNILLPQVKEELGLNASFLNLCIDEEGWMWMHQDRWGLCLYDTGNAKLTYPNVNGSNVSVGQMAKSHSRNAVWVSNPIEPYIVKLVRQGDKLHVAFRASLDAWMDDCGMVTQMLEDAQNRLWILTWRALMVLSPNGELLLAERREKVQLSQLVADRLGKIWAISDSNGICSLELGKELRIGQLQSSFSSHPDESVLFSCIDHNGCLWIASSLGQIYKSDVEKKDFKSVPLEGMVDDCTILKMVVDEHYLWIMTNKKVLKYGIATRTYTDYSTTDGNVGIDLFQGKAACPDGKGGLYVGGHNGVLHISGQSSYSVSANLMSPVVTDVLMDNQSVFFDSAETTLNDIDHIQLAPSAKNIELYLSTLSYGLQERPRIAVKLEGIDKDWVYLPSDRFSAFYNKLSAGDYTFRMKYADTNGGWTECRRTLTIVQQPAWYETWYAYVAYFLLAVFLMVWFVVYAVPLFKKLQTIRKTNIATGHRHIIDLLRILSVQSPKPEENGKREDKGMDELFTEQLTHIIEAHLDENEFDIESCAKELGLSKSTLHRRIKSVTGLTPLEFIRNVKMKRACQLLAKQELSVSEIAYALGFANPKYFTKCFKEELGMTPTEFIQQKNERV
ncbi:MAG: two-component regulator propeller domain-containing protein [Bacteroides sp.]|nr:two-component regulator propeller domain-containing protein [Bacteroides sp.]